MLEAAALASWFLDPAINATERVKRSLIYLCYGKAQLKTILKTAPQIDDFFDNRLPKILGSLGIEFRNSKGNLRSPQNFKPKISDLINKILPDEGAYGILSGIAHGQPLMLAYAGYDVQKAIAAGLKEIEYEPNEQLAEYLILTAVTSFETAITMYFDIFGWDFSKAEPHFAAVRRLLAKATANRLKLES